MKIIDMYKITYKDAQTRFDVVYGLHSNIPMCCIHFFITEWDKMWGQPEKSAYEQAIDASAANYIQCPKCLGSGNKVKLRICRTECGKDCVKEFRELCL